ncbi:MAG: GntR family transcriptional regulator [Opitutaceae bacterium]|nr:GntR family transcriptional regulator [Opitutaceae bacterium]
MRISEYIKNDLSEFLSKGRPFPIDLNLTALAKHYGSSTQPVRTALTELEEAGLLTKKHNRRFVPTLPQKKSLRQKLTTPSPNLPHPDSVYNQIASDLVKQSFEENTTYLREQAAATKYGIGRTVLRQIFLRLSTEGILQHVPRCGWKVRRFKQTDLQDFLTVREALEQKALSQAYPLLDSEILQKYLQNNQDRGGNQQPLIDNELHAYWINLSGNRYIQNFFENNSTYFNLLFDWEEHDIPASRLTCKKHRRILHSLLKKDLKGASKALSIHILKDHPVLEQLG